MSCQRFARQPRPQRLARLLSSQRGARALGPQRDARLRNAPQKLLQEARGRVCENKRRTKSKPLQASKDVTNESKPPHASSERTPKYHMPQARLRKDASTESKTSPGLENGCMRNQNLQRF